MREENKKCEVKLRIFCKQRAIVKVPRVYPGRILDMGWSPAPSMQKSNKQPDPVIIVFNVFFIIVRFELTSEKMINTKEIKTGNREVKTPLGIG